MIDDAATVRNLRRQQAAIAAFGSFALREGRLPQILAEAARVCADGLGVQFGKVCRYRPEENDLPRNLWINPSAPNFTKGSSIIRFRPRCRQ